MQGNKTISELRRKLASGKIEEVIDQLMSVLEDLNSKLFDQVTTLSGQLNRLKTKQRINIDYDDSDRNQVSSALSQIIAELESQYDAKKIKTGNTKNFQLNQLNRELGNSLMMMHQMSEAKKYYLRALKYDPDDEESQINLEKADIYPSLNKINTVDPNLIDIKIDFFLKKNPNDDILLMMKSYREWQKNRPKKAIDTIVKSIQINPYNSSSHNSLGYFYLSQKDIFNALHCFKKAIDIWPNNYRALNNLGFVNKLIWNFRDAINYLQEAIQISPNLLSMISLGDSFQYLGEVKNALKTHNYALKYIDKPKGDLDDFFATKWAMNYMSLEKENSSETTKFSLVEEKEHKSLFLFYALSFDYCSFGDFDKANYYFYQARKLDPYDLYNDYFLNQLNVHEKILKLNQNESEWLLSKQRDLKDGKPVKSESVTLIIEMDWSKTIFLAHASEDKALVWDICKQLKSEGFEPWLDEDSLMPGDNWDERIKEAIRMSRFFMPCISKKSVKKNGYVQRELRMALSEFEKKAPDSIYLIPALLDDKAELPNITVGTISLKDYQAVKIFEPDQFQRLINHLRVHINL